MKPTLFHLDNTASTNTWLSSHVLSLGQPVFKDGDAVVTFRQTDGRGQQGNHWESAPDQNICMSLLLCPHRVLASESFLISEAVSIGVCRFIERLLTEPVTVKWPNDIYVGDRKICGILIENRLEGARIAASVVGIGLNVNQTEFFSDAPNPVSVRQLTGRSYDLMELSAALQGYVVDMYRRLEDGGAEEIQEEYWRRLYRRNGWYSFRDSMHGVFEGRILGVDCQGFITLEKKDDGTRLRYAFKEVSYVIRVTGSGRTGSDR